MILREVSTSENGIGVNAIAKKIGLAKSTTSRILSTLEEWNVVERTAENQFVIGPGMLRLVENQPLTATLKALVRPVIEQISAETGEATLLVVLDGNEALYLDSVPGNYAVQVREWVGEKVPLNLTSGGKLLLAYAGQPFIDDYLAKPLASHTANSVSDPAKLKTQLELIRDRRFAITDGEYDDEVAGITMPVQNDEGEVVAAITVYGPTFRLRPFANRQAILESMQNALESLQISA